MPENTRTPLPPHTAQGAAYNLFQVITRKSEIDSLSEEGAVPTDIRDIEFDSVDFAYAGRPDQLVLNKMSFRIEKYAQMRGSDFPSINLRRQFATLR